ncbi:MAG: hypothetical protein ABI611_05070 [Solirubrobacteraceae bacterium]
MSENAARRNTRGSPGRRTGERTVSGITSRSAMTGNTIVGPSDSRSGKSR